MDLILWRHAEADDSSPDIERKLTKKGREQAMRVGSWLRERLPSHRVVSSPAARARETAEGLGGPIETMPELYGGTPHEILEALGWPRVEGAVVLVGHQPILGELASYLMTRRTEPWAVKKGAAWWFRCEETGRGVATELVASIAPKLV